ncbi:MAG TPA: haloalkane dehalogenase [Cytophagales bacterium]|jgi:haloalkane dehalogenase|nr:haloalkane dehalogenase [Cytophagales bacterium]
MKSLSPNPEWFEGVHDFPYKPNFVDFNGLKMHYIDEGSGETVLALHGEPTWCYLYRKFIPVLQNFRFIAPDFIGFGKSDKLVNWRDYSFSFHLQTLEHFVDTLKLCDITLVVQDWGGLLGLSLLGARPELIKRVVIMNTFLPKGKKLPLPFKIWQAFARYHPSVPIGLIMKIGTHNKLPKEVLNAYKAPFSDRKHKTGAKAFPAMVPGRPDQDGVAQMIRAREVLSKWDKPALVMFSDKDPIMSGMEHFFYHLIPDEVLTKVEIKNAGHFLQEEKGAEIAGHIKGFMTVNQSNG